MQWFPVLVAAIVAAPAAVQVSGAHDYKNVGLCHALENIRSGEVLPVIVDGVYQEDLEFQVFFDPLQPACNSQVQPATWVEFASTVPQADELAAHLRRSKRASVRFRGLLYGPGEVQPDDPSVPFAAAFAKRTRGLRYGHLNQFRTKLVVQAVLNVRPVAGDIPWVWGAKPPGSNVPSGPSRMLMPRYPESALRYGIEGKVVVQVAVEGGGVAKTEVISGDRALVAATVTNIESWSFEPERKGHFVVTFIFSIEDGSNEEGGRSRVEFVFPDAVRVVAPPYKW